VKPILIPLCILLVILTVEKGVSEESLTDQAPVATGSSPQQSPDAVALQWSSGEDITMTGPHDLHQLVLTSHEGDGKKDVTAIAEFSVEPSGIVTVSPTGLIRVIGNGSATIIAEYAGSLLSRAISVNQADEQLPISFPNEIVPIFTRHGCNGGGCHGKAEGQNGFKLSLLGYEPQDDHGYLVREGLGRRIFRASPTHSLLLLKASGELPHQGGSRLTRGSDDYKTIVRWIRQGLPYGSAGDSSVTRISVEPRERLTRAKAVQQLRVVAHFSDGSSKDVTRIAQ
jgi:hypothetical protein